MATDIFALYGTARSGYTSAKEGPFQCATCMHYDGDSTGEGECNHPDVMHDPEVPKDISDGHGDAVVDAGGCCMYWRPRNNTLLKAWLKKEK